MASASEIARPARAQETPQAPGASEIARLARRMIYFGHQSVGENVLDGVRAVLGGRGALRLVESADPGALSAPGWVHSRIGQNSDPEGEGRAFQSLMDSG